MPLSQQDPARWSRSPVIGAKGLLVAAARQGRFGRYQCEAAIQSVHAQQPFTGHVDHAALLTLYDLLAQHAPSLGALVGRAAVPAEAGSPPRPWRLWTRCPPIASAAISRSGWPGRGCSRSLGEAPRPPPPSRLPLGLRAIRRGEPFSKPSRPRSNDDPDYSGIPSAFTHWPGVSAHPDVARDSRFAFDVLREVLSRRQAAHGDTPDPAALNQDTMFV